MNFLRNVANLWKETRGKRKNWLKSSVTALKNRNAIKLLGMTKLGMPSSSQTKLVLPYNCDEETFLKTKFTTEWAEGRITMQEIKEVLEELKKVEFYDPRKLAVQELVKKRQESLNRYLRTTDSKFICRGLRLRAGANGAWIVIEKVGPFLPEFRVDSDTGVASNSTNSQAQDGLVVNEAHVTQNASPQTHPLLPATQPVQEQPEGVNFASNPFADQNEQNLGDEDLEKSHPF